MVFIKSLQDEHCRLFTDQFYLILGPFKNCVYEKATAEDIDVYWFSFSFSFSFFAMSRSISNKILWVEEWQYLFLNGFNFVHQATFLRKRVTGDSLLRFPHRLVCGRAQGSCDLIMLILNCTNSSTSDSLNHQTRDDQWFSSLLRFSPIKMGWPGFFWVMTPYIRYLCLSAQRSPSTPLWLFCIG